MNSTRPLIVDEILQTVQSRINQYNAQQQQQHQRPIVTLTYSQSIDGSIAAVNNIPLRLSSQASMKFTHHLRAIHSAIAIGIGTVLSDNPLLTVRLCSGNNPQPIVFDSLCRIPLNSQLITNNNNKKPIIICTAANNTDQFKQKRMAELISIGCELLIVDESTDTGSVSIGTALRLLYPRFPSIMIEGGGKIINSILNLALYDQLIITICPKLVGGYSYSALSGSYMNSNNNSNNNNELINIQYAIADCDIIMRADNSTTAVLLQSDPDSDSETELTPTCEEPSSAPLQPDSTDTDNTNNNDNNIIDTTEPDPLTLIDRSNSNNQSQSMDSGDSANRARPYVARAMRIQRAVDSELQQYQSQQGHGQQQQQQQSQSNNSTNLIGSITTSQSPLLARRNETKSRLSD